MNTTRVRFGDAARAPLLAGCATFARLLAPTLGPLGRTVVIEKVLKPGSPEVLSTAALVARRTFRLPDPFENAGAMLLRHAVWRVYERTGDGTATTAVLAARLLRELGRLLASDLPPHQLTRALDRTQAAVTTTLRSLARPLEDITDLANVLAPLDLPPEVVTDFLEGLEAIGPEGVVLVDPDDGSSVHVQLVQGVHWQSRLLTPEFVPAGTTSWQLLEPRILLTDWKLEEADQLVPLLDDCARHRVRRLLIVANELGDSARAVLAANLARGTLEQVAVVAAPSVGLQQTRILEDLAALCGGRAFRQQAGERPQQARLADLGSARQVLVTRWTFAVLGGRGTRAAIRQRLALAEAERERAQDEAARRRAQERLARLHGAFLQIRVGGRTPSEREYRLLMLERLARTIQVALDTGLVPGGAASFAVAARALAAEATSNSSIECAVLGAARAALLEPLRILVANAGIEPGPVIHETLARAPQLVYDVQGDCWVDPWSQGLLDPLGVLEAAVEASWSLARAFLSTDVLVHRTWPASSAEP